MSDYCSIIKAGTGHVVKLDGSGSGSWMEVEARWKWKDVENGSGWPQ